MACTCFLFSFLVEAPVVSFLILPPLLWGKMRPEKVPRLPTAGSTVINGKLTLTMDPLPGDLSGLMEQFEIDCIRVKGGLGGKGGLRKQNDLPQRMTFFVFFKLSSI